MSISFRTMTIWRFPSVMHNGKTGGYKHPKLFVHSKGCPTRMRFSCGVLRSVTMLQDAISTIWYSVAYFISYNNTRTKLYYEQADFSTSRIKHWRKWKSHPDASRRNETRRIKNALVWGRPNSCEYDDIASKAVDIKDYASDPVGPSLVMFLMSKDVGMRACHCRTPFLENH